MIFEDIESEFKELENNKTEEEIINDEAYVLQANYLSEIERLYKDEKLNRKELAEKIKISPSYLTQVFKGDKPLNFITIAKIQNALQIRFRVNGEFLSQKKTSFEAEILIDKLKENKRNLYAIEGDLMHGSIIYNQSANG